MTYPDGGGCGGIFFSRPIRRRRPPGSLGLSYYDYDDYILGGWVGGSSPNNKYIIRKYLVSFLQVNFFQR